MFLILLSQSVPSFSLSHTMIIILARSTSTLIIALLLLFCRSCHFLRGTKKYFPSCIPRLHHLLLPFLPFLSALSFSFIVTSLSMDTVIKDVLSMTVLPDELFYFLVLLLVLPLSFFLLTLA